MKSVSLNVLIKRNLKKHTLLPFIPDNLNEFLRKSKITIDSKKHLCGLDLGSHKCGLAFSMNANTVAIPHSIVETGRLAPELCNINAKLNGNISCLIVGMPLSLSGQLDYSNTKRTIDTLSLASTWIAQNNIPIWFADERYSSIESKSGLKKNFRNKLIDDICAMQILQEFLDSLHTRLDHEPGISNLS